VIEQLVLVARETGVELRERVRFATLLEADSRVEGVLTSDGERLRADAVIVAAGAWTPALLPHLSSHMWTIGQPVFHLRPLHPDAYVPAVFPCWTADISSTGWYGFPVNEAGILKIANHGPGRRIHPDEPRIVGEADVAMLRDFLGESHPALADAPLEATRLCLYCDSWDGNFYVDWDPERPGLLVAAGDSGHGFKFVPVLGSIVADVVEQRANRYAARFAWRVPGTRSAEDARYLGTSD
jgi:glycine/D-amino acid oxidase-like deaminating enzyme